jgi:hypothetical protein
MRLHSTLIAPVAAIALVALAACDFRSDDFSSLELTLRDAATTMRMDETITVETAIGEEGPWFLVFVPGAISDEAFDSAGLPVQIAERLRSRTPEWRDRPFAAYFHASRTVMWHWPQDLEPAGLLQTTREGRGAVRVVLQDNSGTKTLTAIEVDRSQ